MNWRAYLGPLVALMIAIALAMLIILITDSRSEDAVERIPLSPPTKYDTRADELDIQAIEKAYLDHISQLFKVWMASDVGQPGRAINGAKHARKAFADAMTAVERRKAMREKQ